MKIDHIEKLAALADKYGATIKAKQNGVEVEIIPSLNESRDGLTESVFTAAYTPNFISGESLLGAATPASPRIYKDPIPSEITPLEPSPQIEALADGITQLAEDLNDPTPKRWRSVITYIDGAEKKIFHEEIIGLHVMVENGPDFYLIDHITTEINPDIDGLSDLIADAANNHPQELTHSGKIKREH